MPIRTPICDLLKIEHPVVLGGMASGTNAALVGAVTNAGGLGILGATFLSPEQQRAEVGKVRELTAGPSNLQIGQTAGLITAITPAAQVVLEVVAEAERIIRGRLSGLVRVESG